MAFTVLYKEGVTDGKITNSCQVHTKMHFTAALLGSSPSPPSWLRPVRTPSLLVLTAFIAIVAALVGTSQAQCDGYKTPDERSQFLSIVAESVIYENMDLLQDVLTKTPNLTMANLHSYESAMTLINDKCFPMFKDIVMHQLEPHLEMLINLCDIATEARILKTIQSMCPDQPKPQVTRKEVALFFTKLALTAIYENTDILQDVKTKKSELTISNQACYESAMLSSDKCFRRCYIYDEEARLVFINLCNIATEARLKNSIETTCYPHRYD